MVRPALVRRMVALTAAGALAFALASGSPASAGTPSSTDPNIDGPAATATIDDSSVIVQLAGDPLATSTKVARSANKQVKLNDSKTKSVRASLAAQRNAFRSWLKTNAPKARMTGEYDFALNAVAVQLNGTDPAELRSAPGVIHVGLQNTYSPTDEDPDLAQIDALAGWTAAGATSSRPDPQTWAGFGVEVGVIDSGIDLTHPCFSDNGYPSTDHYGDPGLTNDKVIAARVFNNKLNQSGFTAEAIDSHGTHVAGTIACNLLTAATVDGVEISYRPSGVAPGARLGNYNVFPDNIENARTEDILNALQAAATDGMDVVNMSLGGDSHGTQDLATLAVDNLDQAGIVVAVAAGNRGPDSATTDSPGSAERALTAGASSVGQIIGVPISDKGDRVTVAAIGEFPTPSTDLTRRLGVVLDGSALSTACAPLPADSLKDKIALISRGTCTFGTKVFHAQQAGAVAAVIVNNVAGDPIAMGGDPAAPSTIPAVMAPLDDQKALMELNGQELTIGATKFHTRTFNDNMLADFSAWGPVDVSYRVKPDVVAPGVNVLSSMPQSSCDADPLEGCWAFMQGTSMAAPHLAGMAAVVRGAHPVWLGSQIRSAIVNTAKVDGVKTTSDLEVTETDVQKVGAGLADLDAAVEATVALSRPSISFGAVPSGSGQKLSQKVTLTNLSGAPLDLALSIKKATGSSAFTVSPASVNLDPYASAEITVSFSAPKKAGKGGTQAHLIVGDAAHAVLYAFIK